MNEDIVYARNTETRCNNCLDFVLYLLKLYVNFTLNKTENNHKTLDWFKTQSPMTTERKLSSNQFTFSEPRDLFQPVLRHEHNALGYYLFL